MKMHSLLFSSILAASLSAGSAWAQNDGKQQKPTQPSDKADQAQPQPAVNQDQAQSAEEQDHARKPASKHDGGKSDVDAIGNRKVGGLDWYSIDTDIKIGRMYAAQIEPGMKMVQDPVVNEYVNRIGQNLVRNSDAKFPFTIKVVEADDINAMALPGGFLYVNSGLILAADDEAELAGVMAHEIAHAALRHATRQMTRAGLMQILSLPVAVTVPAAGPAIRVGAPLALLRFSRDFEAEADYFGIQYMYKAGYDPNALINLFEKIQALEKRKPGTLSRAFATHPQTPNRIQKSQKEIATILAPRDHYIENTSEFDDVKARLAITRNRLPTEEAEQSKPTLRRTRFQEGNP
jgi:beta-barrel assembly-enhancing protease